MVSPKNGCCARHTNQYMAYAKIHYERNEKEKQAIQILNMKSVATKCAAMDIIPCGE